MTLWLSRNEFFYLAHMYLNQICVFEVFNTRFMLRIIPTVQSFVCLSNTESVVIWALHSIISSFILFVMEHTLLKTVNKITNRYVITSEVCDASTYHIIVNHIFSNVWCTMCIFNSVNNLGQFTGKKYTYRKYLLCMVFG